MVEYGRILSEALKFSVGPKRWLPFFVVDIVFTGVMLSILVTNALMIKNLITGTVEGFAVVSSIIGVVGSFFVIAIIWGLIRLYISGAILHQSIKPKESEKSWQVAKGRYTTLLVVSIIVGIAGGIISIVPYIGWLISIVVALAFFFALPIVIFDKKKAFDEALGESYNIFREEIVDVFIVWLLITLVSLAIVTIFLLPLIGIGAAVILPIIVGMESSGEAQGPEIFLTMLSSVWILLPGILIYIAGSAILDVFQLNAKMHFYQKMKK